MHLPSAKLRQEMLSVPQFSRFVMARQDGELTATLIIKASTLTLKYLVRRAAFKVLVIQLDSGKLAYAVLIDDFDEKPAGIWSLLESEEELSALMKACEQRSCPVFLFNEACVNVCSTTAEFARQGSLEEKISTPLVFSSSIPNEEEAAETGAALDEVVDHLETAFLLCTKGKLNWEQVQNYYITNQLSRSRLGILDEDEGNQQEELCTWLTDSLSPTGAFKSPNVNEGATERELTDVLLTYLGGYFVIESKTLAILNRNELPPRSKLRKNILKNIEKALSQLPGAIRNIRAGARVTSNSGQPISLSTDIPPHCIVLVPDLELLTPEDQLGGARFETFFRSTGGFLHILDPIELLRVVQTALRIASLGNTTTPMMAFDATLLERWERARSLDTPSFRVITHFQAEFGKL